MRFSGRRLSVICFAGAAGVLLTSSCGGGANETAAPAAKGPSITSFAAAPSAITGGQSATRSCTVTGATSISISPGIGAVTGSSAVVNPAVTTSYTLTATNTSGTATASATLTVVAPPVITSFAAAPATIANGQGTMLTWVVTGASALSLDQGVGAVTGTSRNIAPTANTTYKLTATNSLGSAVIATTTVTVIGPALPSITWSAGSTVKLEQVIADKDWAAAAKGITTPTVSQTATRYNIFGTDIGSSFEDNGKLLILFGDTRSVDENAVNFHAGDPIGWSNTTDGESGLLLNFFTQGSGLPLFVSPPGVKMGADDLANAGIRLADGLYLVINTGADVTLPVPHMNASSVLARFDEVAGTFTAGRTISHAQGGHFVFTALHASGTDVFMFGAGQFRTSDIYLSRTPATGFWAGTGTQYFTGLVNGLPTWSAVESDAVPVIQDNPTNGPAWPNDSPTVGSLSVAYSTDLGLWLATYDGGRQSTPTNGAYFSYANNPWGPWSQPQLIFQFVRDNGWGVFIHNPNASPNDGLDGPTIGSNDPATTPGGAYAPLLIERFTRVTGNTLKIYYLMSTWNPYTVVKMRSTFTITRP